MPILISRNCTVNDTIDYPYYYKGKYLNGRFEGPGKFEMKYNKKDNLGAKSYPTGELAKMNKTCIINNGYLNRKVMEVVGNFKNGLINGPAKVNLQYNYIVISNFTNGTVMGLQRYYVNKTMLTNYYYAIGGRRISWSWVLWHGYLIYHDYSYIKEPDNSRMSVLVPLNMSKEILVGNVNLLQGQTHNLYRYILFFECIYIENYYFLIMCKSIFFCRADVEITSKDEECVLQLKWNVKEKLDYELFFGNNYTAKIPLKKSEPLCKINQPKEGTPEDKFTAFIKTLEQYGGLNGQRMFEVLKYMPPETSPLEQEKVKQTFMSNVTFETNWDGSYAQISHFGGKVVPWFGKQVSFDNDGQLHGFCSFELVRAYFNTTGQHNFLDWSPKYFTGEFVHGKLQGLVYLKTWRGVSIYASFKDGELHGPAFALGQKFIYNHEVKILK